MFIDFRCKRKKRKLFFCANKFNTCIIYYSLIIMMFNMKKKNLLRVVNDISFKADKDDEESDHASDVLIN